MLLNVLVSDSHRLYVDGLAELIGRISGVRIAVTGTDESVFQSPEAAMCHLAVIGIQSAEPEEIDTILNFRLSNPRVRIILLLDSLLFLHKAFRTEAIGYLLKSDGKAELERAVRYAVEGLPYLSERIGREITRMGSADEPIQSYGPDGQLIQLTRREWQIITLISREYSSGEIAQSLGISQLTVNTHRRNLMKKLGVRNALGLVKFVLSGVPEGAAKLQA